MRLIDADKIFFREIDEIGGEYEPFYGCSKEQIDSAPTVEAIPKADYENRLKADMVAMLTDLMMAIGELDNPKYKIVCNTPYEVGKGECLDLIQERINALRGN